MFLMRISRPYPNKKVVIPDCADVVELVDTLS